MVVLSIDNKALENYRIIEMLEGVNEYGMKINVEKDKSY